MLHNTIEPVPIPFTFHADNTPNTKNPMSIAIAKRRNSLASGRHLTCWKNGSVVIFTDSIGPIGPIRPIQTLIQRKLREVLACAAQWWLRLLEQQMIAHHERVDVRKHETAISIIR